MPATLTKGIEELKEERNKLVKQMRDFVETAREEKRNLTAEEQETFDKYKVDIHELDSEIRNEETLLQIEQRSKELDNKYDPANTDNLDPTEDPENRSQPGRQVPPQNLPKSGKGENRASEEYRSAMEDFLRNGDGMSDENRSILAKEIRSQNLGTQAKGGYLSPTDFDKGLIEIIREVDIFRSLCTVRSYSHDREVPVEDDYGEAFWTDEEANYTESDMDFSQLTMTAHKLTTLTTLTEEFVADEEIGIIPILMERFGWRFGDKEEAAFVSGDGVGKPTGWLNGATGKNGAVAALVNNTIDFEDIFKLKHGVRLPFRKNGTYICNDDTTLALRLLKDGNGRFMWIDSVQAGNPDRLNGSPVRITDHMADIGANNTSVAFGDFKHYEIADRGKTFIQRLDELFAGNGRIGYRAFRRVDGKLKRAEAICLLTHPA